MTFDIGLHEMCVRTGVRYVITLFSGMDGLPNFPTHGAPLRARFGSSAIKVNRLRTIEEKSPKLQQCSFSLSHLSDKTYNYDQNNEKPRREGQKRFP